MEKLEYKIVPVNEFTVIRITEDTKMDTDIKSLKKILTEILDSGSRHIAISFTEKSHLNSLAIGTLVVCAKMIDDLKGEFVIIQPNINEGHILEVLSTTCLINTCASEDKLLNFVSSIRTE